MGLEAKNIIERLADKFTIGDDCWEWTAGSRKGYGAFRVEGHQRQAHVVVYELLVGDVPEGMTLDHACRNHACVNPKHLEPVTNRQNVLRGVGPSAINARKGACPRGHAYDEANTEYRSNGARRCRQCHRERERLRRALGG